MAEYRLDQLVAVPNWHYVTWTGTEHVRQRLYLLALATNTAQSEPGILVGLAYHPSRGWYVVDLEADFCGLIPSDWDLVSFEASNACGHTS